jgi:hypothetical protein
VQRGAEAENDKCEAGRPANDASDILNDNRMNTAELISEIRATYERHGWHLRRMLLRPETREKLVEASYDLLDVAIRNSDFDALWFARASQGNREAWELRLIAENPYALFEAFETNETEEEREQSLREMENRMREHVTAK